MASSKTSLHDVINQVTKAKLASLDHQKNTLDTKFSPILEKFKTVENKSSLEFLKEIHATLKTCWDVDNPIPEETRDQLSEFVTWIQLDDPDSQLFFGSEHLIKHWIERLITDINSKIEKCDYACLYAKVMTQYMDTNAIDLDLEDSGASTDKQKTMEEFSQRIFTTPKNFDGDKFGNFLQTILPNEGLIVQIRECVSTFCQSFPQIYDANPDELKLCLEGLIAEDLLGPQKAAIFSDLKNNEVAIREASTLIKSLIDKFGEWTWPEPVHVDFRRNIAGRYRAYMDEDVITALFLQYIGARWSIYLKEQFKTLYSSKIWIRGTGSIGDLYLKENSSY